MAFKAILSNEHYVLKSLIYVSIWHSLFVTCFLLLDLFLAIKPSGL